MRHKFDEPSKLSSPIPNVVLFLLTVLCSISGFAHQNSKNNDYKPDRAIKSNARVNPLTLAMELSIPLSGYQGRGGNSLPVSIDYSSKVWSVEFLYNWQTQAGDIKSDNRPMYGKTSSAGWTTSLGVPRIRLPHNLYIGSSGTNPDGGQPYNPDDCVTNCQGANYSVYYIKKLEVVMPDGSTHEFRKDDTPHLWGTNQGSGSADMTGTFLSVDGTRMRLEITQNQTILFMPDGSRYLFGQGTTGTVLIDRHGNRMNYDQTNKRWTDTMARVIEDPIPLTLDDINQTQITIGDKIVSFPGKDGNNISYTLSWRYLKDPNGGESGLTDTSQELAYLSDQGCQGDLNRWLSTTANPQPHLFKTGTLYFGDHFTRVCHPISWDGLEWWPGPRFNPKVLTKITLPNGQKYELKYNIYGEIEKIIYPTGAYERFLYGQVPVVLPSTSIVYDQANRGVQKRWVSEKGDGTDELLWEYQGWDVIAPDGSKTQQFFVTDSPYNSQPYGFGNPYLGRAYEDRVLSTSGQLLRRKLTDFETTGPQTGGHPAAFRDSRPTKEISIIFEPGATQALATMTETVYDANADPEYFASLNPKQVKSYRYKILDLTTAQTGNIDTISEMFNASDLAAISETDYLYDPAYKARGILGLPTETRVLNPTNLNHVLAKSQFVYDETAYFDNSYTTTNWENPNSNLRGNVTTTKTWSQETNSWITSHAMFDNFGNVRKVWDTSNDATRFIETEYDPIYKYAYPTRTKAPAPDPTGLNGTNQGSEISRTYDFNTGLLLSVTDANGQTATTEYDSLLRVKKITPPPGGSVSEMFYNDTPGSISVKSMQQIDENNWAESTTFYDNLGRAIKTRTKDLQGDVMSQVKFDSFGRVEKTSNPYRVDAAGNPTEAVYWSKLRYDNQSRVVETYAPAPEGQTGQSLGTVSFGISTLTDLIGTYVVATDASGRKSRAISGIYGLMRVDEATGKGGSADQDLGTLANPTQPTYYDYNIKGELVKITQGNPSQQGQPIQYRYFMYDSFGRLIRVRQPEQTPNSYIATTGNPGNNQWTAAYTYDVFGNVVSVTDAKNTIITNFYDKAGRTTKRTYTDGTPEVEFFYDGKGLPSTPPFSKGALTKVTSTVSEDRFTSFDNHGRLLASQQITDGQTYNFGYKYNLSGGLIEQTYPSGRIVRNFLDTDGGLNLVTSKAGNGFVKRVASDFDYAATGAVRKMKLGNGLWETAEFNQLQQLTEVGLGTTQTNKDLFKIDYEYGELNADGTTVDATKNIGMIAKTTTTIPTTNFVQTFKYDSINRLTEAKETTGSSTSNNWIQTFGYDRFGNRTQFGQTVSGVDLPSNNLTKPTINQSDNRFTTGQGYVYDFNGNLVQDAQGRSFTFNGDDKQTVVRDLSIETTPQNPDANVIGRYSYDGSGARVKKVTNTETTIFVYDAGGALAAEYSTQAPPSDPKTSYLTTDHLGSPRVITDQTGQVTARRDFMPFGEELGVGVGGRTESLKYSNTGTDRVRKHFTGYEKDDETGLDFAEARMYQNKHGRFNAVDPLLASATVLNPQTFNRYAYTGNNPVNFTDPLGLKWIMRTNGAVDWENDDYQLASGEEDVTSQMSGKEKVCESVCSTNGVIYNAGDRVLFGANGTVTVVSRAAQEVASGDAPAAGSTVQSGTQELPVSTASQEMAKQIGQLDLDPCVPASQCAGARNIQLPSDEQVENASNVLHLILGACGFVFDACDVGDGAISGIEGDYLGAGASAPSAIPILGIGTGATKLGRRLDNLLNGADSLADGRRLRNSHLANGVHPKTGVPFDSNGFPDFSGHLFQGGKNDLIIKPSGRRDVDVNAANKAANYKSTPEGFTWHHHQDTGRMQLVDSKIHAATGHTGGNSIW